MMDLSGVISSISDSINSNIEAKINAKTTTDNLSQLTYGGFRGITGLDQGDGENMITNSDVDPGIPGSWVYAIIGDWTFSLGSGGSTVGP